MEEGKEKRKLKHKALGISFDLDVRGMELEVLRKKAARPANIDELTVIG